MGLFLKNPIIALICVLSLVGAFGSYTAWIYHQGVQAERGACNSEKKGALDANIKIKEKQDGVLRADDAAYIDSLRNGTF